MKWEEVRRLFPNQYLKLRILDSYQEDGRRIVTEVALINTISDPKIATRELLQANGNVIVYHTGNEEIYIDVREPIGFRGIRL
ncbi:hypothetical protein [Ornithinibacillus californiensis]|uniref:hypothetical protein n=1 Tax=Ornithinibacillus californiensis TaxID=161536 RepID=UPI00064DF270|nr:hypothetical protein [Ornithinibacillus californiensis]